MIKMNKIIENDTILYLDQDDIEIVLDINNKCHVVVYHFVSDHSFKVDINLNFSGAVIDYYCNVINYSTNNVVINVYHNESNTVSKIYNHGVNVLDNKLDFLINGIVPKGMVQCICNQENQIINIRNGKSTICPNLLIECFDVNSSHSAYIGRFNLEKIFYLESRGINRKVGYQLLLKGFLVPVGIEHECVQKFLLKIEDI